ncbi:MAG: hypothetical protein M3Y57_13410 [Acidobacteriota bacterium]|nr:hypothetical protein [Acidobacteriota bacterium]
MIADDGPPPEVSEYFRKIGKKYGHLGAAVTNAKLSSAQRKRNAKKAGDAATAALTPEERKERASNAAKKRWADVKKAQATQVR